MREPCPRRHPGDIWTERRLGARLSRVLRTEGNPDHRGADSGEAVFNASPMLGVNFRFCHD